ncbi:hypothetical protein GGF42_004495 [Coemansia sp. RSA 2424]|nr:hypothetical protein GGF42_004495 [Coemansia sp. RSA 2424]
MSLSKLDTITGRMSKLMLRRWPMLAEQCHEDGCNAPLMRNPESGDAKCVWHDASELFPDEMTAAESPSSLPSYDSHMDDEKLSIKNDDSAATVSPTESKSASEDAIKAQEPTKADMERQRKREQGDLASQLIAKRLLQGWAMIDQACPNESCYSVPLVQDRNKTQLCVVCGQHYMDEEVYTKKYGALPPATAASSISTSSSSGPAPTTASKPSETQVLADLPAPIVATAATTTTASSEKVAARSADVETRPAKRRHGSAAVGVAVKALESKLAQLSAQLAEATDYRDICAISKAIGACARAIHECQPLGQHH